MSVDIGKFQLQAPAQSIANKGPKKVAWYNRDISLPGQGWNDKKKERLYNELHTLLTAGIDLRSALELLSEERTKKAEALFYTDLCDKIVSGESLSDALEATGKFSPYEYYSIKIGEESGRLLEILNELQEFYVRKIKLKRQLVGVLTYPTFVFAVSLGVIWFMLTNIVPMFADVFKRFNGELPELTRFVIDLSKSVGQWMPMILLTIAGITIFIISQRKAIWFRRFTGKLIQRIPFFGPMLVKVYLARFCQSMQLLIAAKTPLVDALDMVGKMIRFYPLEEACETMKEQLSKGIALNQSMRPFNVFERRMVSLVKVAEEVNQLDIMFAKLGKQYSEEVEHKTNVMGNVIEPLMIVFIAVFVGAILVAMYLPLFELSSTIG